MRTSTKVILAIALCVIVASFGFIAGFATSHIVPDPVAIANGANSSGSSVGSAVDQVRKLLDERALEPPSESSATAGAINGLLESNGDKYGMYFDAKHYKAFNEDTMGSFGGIGVALGQNKDGKAYVVEVYDNTPAQRAGIKQGDIFVGVDGVKRDKWTTEEVVKRVRGEEGTTVTVVMQRPAKDDGGEPTEVTFKLTRAKIDYPNVKSEMFGNVGYIRVGQFNMKAAEEIAKAVEDLTKKGAKALVLDLRDNPGGLLDEAVDVSSLFIQDGVIVRVDERDKPEQTEVANGNKITDLPMVVLINNNSASASEITAGALQDYGRAVLLGEKSFGKGSVQTIEELPGGTAVKFTIAHYLTPKSRVINNVGLTPDVIIPMDPMKEMDKKTDVQLQQAIELAKKKAAGK